MATSEPATPERAEAKPLLGSLFCPDDGPHPSYTSLRDLAGDALEKTSAKLAGKNKRYFNHVTLALAMAFWITVFGLPAYSSNISWSLFGRKDICGDNKMGFKTNIGTPEEPILVNLNATLIADGYLVTNWCGFLPGSYQRAWPAIVQTMLFTVYLSTGSTVKLAWQGLAGTFCAVVNVIFMCHKYPDGGADVNYSPMVAWLDLFFMLFLFLATKASTNTMMYGMSWTVGLMMHFMNPTTGPTLGTYKSPIPYVNWDGETTVTILTAFVGSVLAIAATLFPRPMLNIQNVHSDSEEIVKGIKHIANQAIGYWRQDKPTMRCYALYAKIGMLSEAVKRVSANLEDSYWETFDLWKFGRIRNLYAMFYQAVIRNSDEIFLLKSAVSMLDFEGKDSMHKKFVEHLQEPLVRLKDNAIDCLVICCKSCQDGSISLEERATIQGKRSEIAQAQQDLCNKLQLVMKEAPYISENTAAENLFVFAISQWAQETSDFANDLAMHEDNYLKKHSKYSWLNFIKSIFASLASTFDPKAAFDREQLRYVFVNLGPILITFALALHVDGSVFTQYSAVMPSLLTLLVTTDHGIPFIKNAQRLTGVVFGHTLPLLVMSVVHLMGCHDHGRTILHASSIFIFFFAFTFMYYASDQWSSVGCLVAGFGVYSMLAECHDHDESVHYDQQYKDIAQVIIAIMLKIAFTQAFAKSSPRDDAVQKVERINVIVNKAYTCFFEGDLHGQNGLLARRDELKRSILELEGTAALSDPNLDIVPGKRTPFKFRLLESGMAAYRLILSDLDMLALAMAGHQHETVQDDSPKKLTKKEQEAIDQEAIVKMQQELAMHKLMKSQASFEAVRKDMQSTMEVTLSLFLAILRHDTEQPLEAQAMDEIKKMTKVNKLDDLATFYKECSERQKKPQNDSSIFKDYRSVTELRRTRLAVATNALSLSVLHATDLAAACFDHMSSV